MAKVKMKLDVNSIVQNTPKVVDELPEKTPSGYVYECDGYMYISRETKQFETNKYGRYRKVTLIKDNLLKCAEDYWNNADSEFYVLFCNENFTHFYYIKCGDNKSIVYTKEVFNENDELYEIERNTIYENGKWYMNEVYFNDDVYDDECCFAGEELPIYKYYKYEILPDIEQRYSVVDILQNYLSTDTFIDEIKGVEHTSNVCTLHSTFKYIDFTKIVKYEDLKLYVSSKVAFNYTFNCSTLTNEIFNNMFVEKPIITSMYNAFNMCDVDELDFSDFDTSECENYLLAFGGCTASKIKGLNVIGCTGQVISFRNCKNLTELELFNIKTSLDIEGVTLLTTDSLIHTAKELIDTGSAKTLTLGTTNLNKLANVYVRLTGEPEEDPDYPKYPCEVCNADDEGAMLITDYITNEKGWTIV